MMLRGLLVLLAVAVVPLAAQDRDPDRPDLPEAADTNSALAYFEWGVSRLERDPDDAADAFYWASRLVPSWATPLYARRIAMLLEKPRRLVDYMERKRRVMRSDEIRYIDSLELRARQIDPFIHRTFDWTLARTYLMESTMRNLRRRYPRANVEAYRDELQYEIDGYLQSGGGAEWRAWRAYSNGSLAAALGHYAEALEDSDDKSGLHLQRGQIFYLLQQHDSAQAELTRALELTREEDAEDLVMVYRSKAMLEYSIGMVLESAGKPDEAREAYSRALMEDMSFYAAHVQMGALALAAGDTLICLTEYGLAVEVEPDLPWLRAMFGDLHISMGQHAEAVEQLQQAIELDPYFADPYLSLGNAHAELGNTQDAVNCYEDFLVRAMASHERRPWVEERIGALGGVP